MHVTPTSHAGGCKVTFPRAVMAASEDTLALWRQAEQAQAMAEDSSLPRSIRSGWHELMDELQECERARLVLLQRTAESHDRAVGEAPTPRCREYTSSEVGYDSLMAMCRKRCRKVTDRETKNPAESSGEVRGRAG